MDLFGKTRSNELDGFRLKNNKTMVIVDTSYIARRAFHTTGDLSHNNFPTGTLFGFLTQIKSLTKLFSRGEISYIFTWDSPYNLRKTIYSQYKQKDHKEVSELDQKREEDYWTQMAVLERDCLRPLGFENHLEVHGLEADDIIASLVFRFHKTYDVFIVSSDHDLFQLLDKAVMYRPHKKKNFTESDLLKEIGVSASQWIDVMCITGCDTDNIAGVYGVGVSSAVKYVKGEKSEIRSDRLSAIESDSGKRIVKRNRELIELPYKGRMAVPSTYTPRPRKISSVNFRRELEALKKRYNFNFTAEVW